MVMDNKNCLQKSSRQIISVLGKKSLAKVRNEGKQNIICSLLSKEYECIIVPSLKTFIHRILFLSLTVEFTPPL
jgi:hypothetical protein